MLEHWKCLLFTQKLAHFSWTVAINHLFKKRPVGIVNRRLLVSLQKLSIRWNDNDFRLIWSQNFSLSFSPFEMSWRSSSKYENLSTLLINVVSVAHTFGISLVSRVASWTSYVFNNDERYDSVDTKNYVVTNEVKDGMLKTNEATDLPNILASRLLFLKGKKRPSFPKENIVIP